MLAKLAKFKEKASLLRQEAHTYPGLEYRHKHLVGVVTEFIKWPREKQDLANN